MIEGPYTTENLKRQSHQPFARSARIKPNARCN